MAAVAYCPSCGAPATPGAGFCAYCGAALPTPASRAGSAAPSSATPPPAYPPRPPRPSYGSPPGDPPARRSRRTLIVVVLVVVILVIASLAVVAFFFLPAPPPVQVQNIEVWAPDNVCGMNANPIGFSGYNASTGENVTLEFGMPNFNSTSCTIRSAVTNTSGFALFAVEAPLAIPANGTGWMNITIESPSSDFNGNLFLVLT